MEEDRRTYTIIGAAMEVHKILGHGSLEPVYQEALALELTNRAIPFKREIELTISYKGNNSPLPIVPILFVTTPLS